MTYLSGPPDVHVTGRRIVATLIDGLLFSVLNGALATTFNTHPASSGFEMTTLTYNGSLGLGVIVVLYYVLLEGLTGRTVGKLVTGIRVIDAQTGGVPGLLSGLLRTVLRLIDGIFAYLVGFIVVLNSDRRRRLGDMAAKTLVVRA
jgi:uncharacterized RDD family membrane protein YckC